MPVTMFRRALVAMILALAAAFPASAAGVIDNELPDLVAKLLPSCVNITTTRYKEVKIVQGQSVVAEKAEPDEKRAYGSGFIVTPDGYVVTNKHVTVNGINYTVTFADGRRLPADLISEAVAYDIAVLKIRSNETWTPVTLGDSNTVRQGDAVIAIGNPIDHPSTVTTGIISALNRDLGFTEFDDYMQTDAAINEGNSGGPLFNWKGEVIGVNTAIFTTAESSGNIGIGFVIPINDAKFIVQRMKEVLLEKKHWRPAWLGASAQSLTPNLAAAYGLPGPWGSIIAHVDAGGPAAQAGLRVGDIVTTVDGNDRKDSRALMRNVVQAQAGSIIQLGVWRDGKQEVVAVTLAELPPGWTLPTYLGGGGAPKPDIPASALVNFGLRLASITPELRTKYNLDETLKGVVITGVSIGSEAANHNINAGMVILRVRDNAVSSPDDVLKSVDNERQQKRARVPMLIADSGGLRWVPLSLN